MQQTIPSRLGDVTVQRAANRKVQAACKTLAHFMLGNRLELVGEFSKATVPGMVSTDSVADALASFKTYILRPTVLAQLTDALRADPRVPLPSESSAGTAYFVAEGEPAPTTRLSFASHTLGSYTLLMLMVLSRELLRKGGPSADAAILSVARRTVRRTLDRAFLSDDAATSSTPAGVMNGMITFSGGSPSNLAADLDQLLSIVSDGDPSLPVFVASPRAIAYLAQQEGNAFAEARVIDGRILGAPLIASAAAGNRLIAIDQAEIAIFDGDLRVDRSTVAALDMSDAPSAPSSVTSLWQTDAVGVKLEHDVSWMALSDDAAAALEITDLGASPA
jgi:hypothetical protein